MMSDKEITSYLLSLQVGEEVIETGRNCYHGVRGVIYESAHGHGRCVKWADGMGTAVTHGTRRLADARPDFTL